MVMLEPGERLGKPRQLIFGVGATRREVREVSEVPPAAHHGAEQRLPFIPLVGK